MLVEYSQQSICLVEYSQQSIEKIFVMNVKLLYSNEVTARFHMTVFCCTIPILVVIM